MHNLTAHPLWFYLPAVSLITFCVYGYDKYRAIHQKRRVPESTLHLLTLLGGTPGAFAGQLIFRHKTRKWKFRIIFFLILLTQISLILLLWIFKIHNSKLS